MKISHEQWDTVAAVIFCVVIAIGCALILLR
jgi:hypothetical protein